MRPFLDRRCDRSVGSSLSSAFLGRTSAGRLDTDQLNLGFLSDHCLDYLGGQGQKNLAGVGTLWRDGGGNTYVSLVVAKTHFELVFSACLSGLPIVQPFIDTRRPLGAVYLALIGTLNFGPSIHIVISLAP